MQLPIRVQRMRCVVPCRLNADYFRDNVLNSPDLHPKLLSNVIFKLFICLVIYNEAYRININVVIIIIFMAILFDRV